MRILGFYMLDELLLLSCVNRNREIIMAVWDLLLQCTDTMWYDHGNTGIQYWENVNRLVTIGIMIKCWSTWCQYVSPMDMLMCPEAKGTMYDNIRLTLIHSHKGGNHCGCPRIRYWLLIGRSSRSCSLTIEPDSHTPNYHQSIEYEDGKLQKRMTQ